MERNQQAAVVFAGDYAYIRQIETSLKSLLYHNRHLKIYIFNQDIPREWFVHYRHLLASMGSELVDVKLFDTGFNQNWTLNHNIAHINYMTFARYFIPQFVAEDVVLYLDVDLIVTADLTELLNTDISQYYLGAAHAAFGHGIGFNAGVMLINNQRWKRENIIEELISFTEREHENLLEGDQTVLNTLMGHDYLLLDEGYNYQIGYDHGAVHYGHLYLFDRSLEPLPPILHYVSADKPWKTHSKGRLRDIWWHYNLMEWSQILEKWQIKPTLTPIINRKKALILTQTDQIAHIEELILALPNWEFHITAFTNMSPRLLRLEQYENVVLHPHVLPPLLLKHMANCAAYLDIDCGEKFSSWLSHLMEIDKSVLSFPDTQASIFQDYPKHLLVSELSELIKYLNQI